MTELLGNAFVKIQIRGEPDHYAGCGFCIDNKHIVTCTHVIDDAIGDKKTLSQGEQFRADMPYIDRKNISVEVRKFFVEKGGNITFNEHDDIALLKFSDTTQNFPDPHIAVTRPYQENNVSLINSRATGKPDKTYNKSKKTLDKVFGQKPCFQCSFVPSAVSGCLSRHEATGDSFTTLC